MVWNGAIVLFARAHSKVLTTFTQDLAQALAHQKWAPRSLDHIFIWQHFSGIKAGLFESAKLLSYEYRLYLVTASWWNPPEKDNNNLREGVRGLILRARNWSTSHWSTRLPESESQASNQDLWYGFLKSSKFLLRGNIPKSVCLWKWRILRKKSRKRIQH